jgi:hypothetical protein
LWSSERFMACERILLDQEGPVYIPTEILHHDPPPWAGDLIRDQKPTTYKFPGRNGVVRRW